MKRTKIIPFIAILAFTACSTLQNNPGIQAAETAGFGIGMEVATGSPAFGFVAPIAVNGLTALANGSNPTAVTGIVAQDVPLITSTVKAAIPNSTGKTVAAAIAAAYTNAMAKPGVPQTPTGANAVIAAIASGLTNAASTAATLPTQASAKLPTNWISMDGIPHLCHAYGVTIDPAAFKRNQWKREAITGQISAADYRSLVRGQKDVAKIEALTSPKVVFNQQP